MWCTAYNCAGPDLTHCSGCAACESAPLEETCADWCLVEGWLDCAQPEQCGGCPGCKPYPPPPPLERNAIRANPFATPGGWFINPSFRTNVLRTLASARDASDAEKHALTGMANSPAAIWIDTSDKLRGAHEPGSLEGVLANVSNEAAGRGRAVELCVFVLYNLPHRDCSAKASGA